MSSSKSKSGGATFTPRLPEGQRPKYPPFRGVATDTAAQYLRSSAVTALLTFAVAPFYFAAVAALTADVAAGGWGLSERAVFTLLASLAHTGTYVVVCGALELARHLGLVQRYAFARLDRQVPTVALQIRTLAEAAVGQLVVTPLGACATMQRRWSLCAW
jgi:hypothetical protein